MARLKRRLLIIGALMAGMLAFRAVRKRRSQPTSTAIEVDHENPHSAAEHAAAAADHANIAAKKALTMTERSD